MLRTACIHLLQACNLTCTHCWSNSSPRGTKILHRDDVAKVVREFAKMGLEHLSLSGGEPLLYDGLANVVKDAVLIGLRVTITTNGMLYSRLESLIDSIGSDIMSRVAFRVSVDGGIHSHEEMRGRDTYSAALRGVDIIRVRTGWVGINTVIGDEIQSDFGELCAVMSARAVDHWALMTLAPRGKSKSPVNGCQSLGALEHAIALAQTSGFRGELAQWDYITIRHAYVLVEHDGRVLVPGVYENEDLEVGTVRNLDIQRLETAVADFSHRTFFGWKGSRSPPVP